MLKQLSRTYLGTTIPVVSINGVIKPELTQAVEKRLKQISTTRAVALAVAVNSPGGLPVQSQLIAEKIGSFAKKNNLKVYTFARDVAASGGYLILSSGDHVVADSSSIVGSIGVVFTKFRLQGLLNLASLENKRIASNNKLLTNILNPFGQMEQTDKEYLKQLCSLSHDKFISYVKKHRGNKLKGDTIFTGEVFTGNEAVANGLVDEIGSMVQVLARRHPGARLDLEPERKSLLHRALNL